MTDPHPARSRRLQLVVVLAAGCSGGSSDPSSKADATTASTRTPASDAAESAEAAPEAYRQGLEWLTDLADGGQPTDGCAAA